MLRSEVKELVASKSTYSCILMVIGQHECSDSDCEGEKLIVKLSQLKLYKDTSTHADGERVGGFALDYCTYV